MDVDIAYGKGRLRLYFANNNVSIIKPYDAPGINNEKEAIKRALEQPVGTPPLRNIVGKNESVAIVISDKTRPTPSHKIVPAIIDVLTQIPCGEIIIINGTGTHKPNTVDELKEMLGSNIVDRFRVINHNCYNESELTYLGETRRQTPVWLNNYYLKAERKIVIGFIEPHFFAGFSGGCKGIVPGVAGLKTIMRLHRAAFIEDPSCDWGVLENNPLQEDITEACLMAKPDFCVNVTLNRQYDITGVFAGDVVKAHRRGCVKVREESMTMVEGGPFDIVVTSNGGYPLDQNLYQAVKGMAAAARIVRQGGTIVCLAECCDGIPSQVNYHHLFALKTGIDELLNAIRTEEIDLLDKWQVQAQLLIQKKAQVYVYSSLSDSEIRSAKLEPVRDVQSFLNKLNESYGPDAKIAVLPEGPYTVPYLKTS